MNFIQNISMQLSAVGNGSTSANGNSATIATLTVTTKQAIEGIGIATSNTFSANAQLLAVAPIYYATNMIVTTNNGKRITNSYVFGYPGNPAFQVRDGTRIVDVTPYITFSTLNNNYIGSYTMTPTGGYSAYKQYRVRTMTVSATGVGFSGQGFDESPAVIITVQPGVVILGYDDNWSSFTGVANEGSTAGVLQGTLSATFQKVE
jgi:hypothetical protein